MSDSMEPEQPKKKPRPGELGAPLPRLWKVEPEEDSSEKEIPKKPAKVKKAEAREPLFQSKKSKDAKKAKDAKKKAKDKEGKDGAGKTVLVEETPELDTYESRQRIRIIIGSVATALFLLVGFLIFRNFAPSPKVEEVSQEDLLLAASQKTAGVSREREESEAKSMLNRAKEMAKNGKVEPAIQILNKVSTAYPTTLAAKEAKAALERPTKNLPLFPDRPAILADRGTPALQPSASPATPTVGTPPPAAAGDPTSLAMKGEILAKAAETPVVAPVVPSVPKKVGRPLPSGFHPRPGSELDESGWPYEIVGERDGSNLVLVPGGIFIQGRDDADASEGPAHEVKLSTYYIDKHEVTNRQFDIFQKEAGRRSERSRVLSKENAPTKGEISGAAPAVVDSKDELPVVMVTAREAKDYADWSGKNLPTEAQWEIAGRTSDGRVYPWGPTPPSWSKPRLPKQIDAVMSYPEDASAYGAFDLAGNVWEWTKDWYDARYYQQFKNSTAENPTGLLSPPRSKQLVVKGGDKDWALTRREGLKVETRLPYLGFRCVLQVEGPGNAFEPKAPATPPPGQQNGQPGAAGGAGESVPF